MALYAWAVGDRITAARLITPYNLFKGVAGGTDSITLINGSTFTMAAVAADGFVLPQAAGAAPTTEGALALNETGDLLVFGDGSTTRTVVTTDQTQTLTNKTITLGGTLTMNGQTISGAAVFNNALSGITTLTASDDIVTTGATASVVAGASAVVNNEMTFFGQRAGALNIGLRDASQAADEEIVELFYISKGFGMRFVNDAHNSAVNAFVVNRGTGTAITDIDLNADLVVTGDINPEADGTRDLGTQTTAQWANVWADLVNGADYSYLNGWRTLEAEKYEGYPVGFAIGNTGFTNGEVTERMPQGHRPVFAVTDEFIEYKGRRIAVAMLDRLIALAERRNYPCQKR